MDHHLEIVKTNIKYPIVFYNHQFNKSRPVSSHYHQDIEVVYVVSGKVEAFIDGKKYFIKGKCLLLTHIVYINSIFLNLHIYIHIYCQLMSLKNFKFNLISLN